jgi:hypothetical protein
MPGCGLLHPHHTVDDHGVDVVADPALDQALDGIAHGAQAQRVATGEVDDHHVGLGARGEAAEIVAAERAGAAERGRLKTCAAVAALRLRLATFPK